MSELDHKRTRFGTFLLGLLFLLFGVLLLIGRTGVLSLDFTKIGAFAVLFFGGFEAIASFASSNQGRLFWGVVLFLSALLALLVSYGVAPGSWHQVWPSVLVIPGLAFLMLYFSHPSEYSLLTLSGLFVFVGIALLIARKDGFSINEWAFGSLRVVVPVAVVVAGIYIIWKNFIKTRP